MPDSDHIRDQLAAELAELRQQFDEQNHHLSLQAAVERVRAEAASMQQSGDLGKVMLALWNGLAESTSNFDRGSLNIADMEAGTWQCFLMLPIPEEMFDYYNSTPYLYQADVAPGVHLMRSELLPLEFSQEHGHANPYTEPSFWVAPEDFPAQLEQMWGGPVPGAEEIIGCHGFNIPFAHGGIWAMAEKGKEFDQRDLDVAMQFSDAMSLGYTRFLDLQAAEQRSRQLAREAAVERVRAEALSMRSSDGMYRVVAVLYREILDQGIDSFACTVGFLDEDAETGICFNAYVNPRKYGLTWPENSNIREIDENSAVVCYPSIQRQQFSDAFLEMFTDPDTGRVEFDTGKVISKNVNFQRTQEQLERDFPGIEGDTAEFLAKTSGQAVATNVAFQHGIVGFNEARHDEEHVLIVRELTEALGLGYTRYLDFKNLEEQNRNLEAERSLERVRTEVAGMEESDDLPKVVEVIEEVLKELGVPCDGVTICIIDAASGEARVASDSMAVVPLSSKAYQRLFEHWKRHQTWSRSGAESFRGEDPLEHLEWRRNQLLQNPHDKREWEQLKEIKSEIGLSDRDIQKWLETGQPPLVLVMRIEDFLELAKDTWVVDAPFSHGTLAMGKRGLEPYTDDEIHLLERFTEVFELAYARFLDLQAAEERSRQMAIERSVERVRAATLAMRTREDFLDVAAVLARQMEELGFETPGCNITFIDEDSDYGADYCALQNPRKYGASWNNSAVTEIDDDFIIYVREATVATVFGAEEFTVPGWRESGSLTIEIPSKVIQEVFGDLMGIEFPPELIGTGTRIGTAVYFQHGKVGFNESEYNEEHVAIMKQLVDAMALGVVRFIDFQKVEDAQQKLIDEMEEELQTAHDMQMNLMPERPPEIPGLDIAGRCLTANHVGGDFFQFFPHNGKLAITLADVTGHAMEAAIPAVLFSGILDNQMESGASLEQLFSRLNRSMHRNLDSRTFVCFAAAELDLASRAVRLANGGCPYPYHYRSATNDIVELQVEAYPLGVQPDVSYPILDATLSPGDRLIFCSDGIVEATDTTDDLFGFERTATAILDGCRQNLSAADLIEHLFARLKGFTGDVSQGDDQTVVVVNVEP